MNRIKRYLRHPVRTYQDRRAAKSWNIIRAEMRRAYLEQIEQVAEEHDIPVAYLTKALYLDDSWTFNYEIESIFDVITLNVETTAEEFLYLRDAAYTENEARGRGEVA